MLLPIHHFKSSGPHLCPLASAGITSSQWLQGASHRSVGQCHALGLAYLSSPTPLVSLLNFQCRLKSRKTHERLNILWLISDEWEMKSTAKCSPFCPPTKGLEMFYIVVSGGLTELSSQQLEAVASLITHPCTGSPSFAGSPLFSLQAHQDHTHLDHTSPLFPSQAHQDKSLVQGLIESTL